jgi:hypothetical protein
VERSALSDGDDLAMRIQHAARDFLRYRVAACVTAAYRNAQRSRMPAHCVSVSLAPARIERFLDA